MTGQWIETDPGTIRPGARVRLTSRHDGQTIEVDMLIPDPRAFGVMFTGASQSNQMHVDDWIVAVECVLPTGRMAVVKGNDTVAVRCDDDDVPWRVFGPSGWSRWYDDKEALEELGPDFTILDEGTKP